MSLIDKVKTGIAEGVEGLSSAFGGHVPLEYIESSLNAKNFRRVGFVATGLLVSACAQGPERRPSALETIPMATYSPEERSVIEQQFNASPLQFSQQYGNMLLRQMQQINPGFVREFAQIPELNDSINPQEVRAMESIYNLIAPLEIPPDFYKEKTWDTNVPRVVTMQWSGNKKSKWDGQIVGKVLDAEPIGFEEKDRINPYYLEELGILFWKSTAGKGDTDGITVTLEQPIYSDVSLRFNKGKTLSFTLADALGKELVFNEQHGLDGTLRITGDDTNLPSDPLSLRAMVLRDMVLAGKGDNRYSAPLQALLWGYMDGFFGEKDDNPLDNYQGDLAFVRPIWSNMEGPRWEKYEDVIRRMNTPKLIAWYMGRKFQHKVDASTYYPQRSKKTFRIATGDCKAYTLFALAALKPAGYDVKMFTMDHRNPKGHTNLVVKGEDGLLYTIGSIKGMAGPFSSLNEIKKAFGFEGKPTIIEYSYSQMMSRFGL